MSPPSFPPQVPSSDRPLPSAGSSGASSPTSPVLSANSDFSPPVAPRFVSFAQHYHRFVRLRSLGSARFPRGPGPLLSRRPRRLISVERTRPPRFLGDPYVHAPLFDPGGPPAPGHYRTGDGVFRLADDVDSASRCSRGSITRPARSLCTLRSRGRPRTTQHSIPAGGQP